MIERNRGFDRIQLSSLETKIKELESQITEVKKVGEVKKLDQLEQSLCIDVCIDDGPEDQSLLIDYDQEPIEPQLSQFVQIPQCIQRHLTKAHSLEDALKQLICFVEAKIDVSDLDSRMTFNHLRSQLVGFMNPVKKTVGV